MNVDSNPTFVQVDVTESDASGFRLSGHQVDPDGHSHSVSTVGGGIQQGRELPQRNAELGCLRLRLDPLANQRIEVNGDVLALPGPLEEVPQGGEVQVVGAGAVRVHGLGTQELVHHFRGDGLDVDVTKVSDQLLQNFGVVLDGGL